MQYRKFGKLPIKVFALGFGCMRLPTLGTETEIDEPAAIEMLRHAIDRGVNYVDTAYPYHGGKSEVVVGRALQNGYRKKVYLATKSPIWLVEKREDFDRFLNEQLSRLQTDHIDFYLLHNIQKKLWPKMLELDALRWAEKAKADGRIGEIGFSFHDTYETFVEIVDAYDWAFCQIQYNYTNEDVQAGTKGLKYAAQKGLAVLVMEPLFGGTLAHPPAAVQEIWNGLGEKCHPADLALRWLWDKPEVATVLSGMSTLEQVEQNLASAGRSGVGWLDDEEAHLVARLREKYKELSPIPCTKCGYCLPCPNGVSIPVNFELYNQATVFKGSSVMLCRNLYASLPESERASACRECGTCEEKCPQQISIGEMLGVVQKQFT